MQYKREILDSIRRILRSLRNSSRAAETEVGLSGAQLLVLQLLKSGKPYSINDLARATQTHQSSVSVVVSKLAEAELVQRRPSPDDARRVEVVLSASGSRLLAKKTPQLAQERLFAAIESLSEAKQKQLATLLQQIVDEAGFSAEPATLFFEDDVKGKDQ